MQESGSKLYESLHTTSQNAQHNAAKSDLDEFVFDFSYMLTDAESCVELNADLVTDEFTTDSIFYDLQTDKGNKRKHSETDGSSDPPVSSDTSGYESDSEDEREVKRAKRKKLRARISRDDTIPSPGVSRGVKSDLQTEDADNAPDKRLHDTPATDESPASESSLGESIIDALGLELSSDSSSDSEENVASYCEPLISSYSEKYIDSDSSSGSDTFSELDDSSSDSDFSSDSESSIGYSTYSDSNIDSDASESDPRHASRIPKCPKSCVCRAGPSDPPTPIERESAVGTPLLKRLLLKRLLGPANKSPYYCCRRKCCLKWEKGFRR